MTPRHAVKLSLTGIEERLQLATNRLRHRRIPSLVQDSIRHGVTLECSLYYSALIFYRFDRTFIRRKWSDSTAYSSHWAWVTTVASKYIDSHCWIHCPSILHMVRVYGGQWSVWVTTRWATDWRNHLIELRCLRTEEDHREYGIDALF